MKNTDDRENRLLTLRAPMPADLRTHACTHAHAYARPTHAAVSRRARCRARSAAVASRIVRGFAPMPPPLQHVHELPACPSILPPQVYYCCSQPTPLSTNKTQQRQY
ncbi:hypothetical protein QTP88_013953 [Uroleucon formosanum]